MSVGALDWAFKAQIKNPGAKFVLIALANYANSEGLCYPSKAHISKMTGISERTIIDHLKFLEEGGFLERRPRYLDGTGQTSNQFLLNVNVTPPSEMVIGGDDVASPNTLDYTEDSELRSGASAPPVSEKPSKPEKPVDLLWTEFLALLTDNFGMEPVAARKVIGKLCSAPPRGFGTDLVHAVYDENRPLILRADEPVAYFTKLLDIQKNKTPEDREAERQLRDAQNEHAGLYQNCEFRPAFDPKRYVGRYPMIERFITEA